VGPVLASWVQGEVARADVNEVASRVSSEEASEAPVQSFWF